ncbi:MAG: 5-bromo-4-chloroindolyl phosphate hydrolysis family protein [Senegalia sp. (in: firmicutes)]|uniref:5-bromo-4-chloroindolyl phosphate hydrolysis family protein n=1 Tax=Senegalia sp. (in: firmicutes) TaxID=1924098 RepID=UPI003F9AA93C
MTRQGKNLGDEIKKIVQDSLNNRDFNKLNKDIKIFVKGALDEVKGSIDLKTKKNHYTKVNYNIPKKPTKKNKLEQSKYSVPVGQLSSLVQIIFGIVGSSIFGIIAFVMILLGYSTGGGRVFHTIAIGISPLFITSIILYFNGKRMNKRLKRFKRYVSQLKGRSYSSIKSFSNITGLSERAVVKDLRKMIEIGMFPEGHIDEKNTYFILNTQTFEEYLILQKSIEMKNKVDKEERIKNNRLDPQVKKTIDDGNNFIEKIKKSNEMIPGEEISIKLDKLEDITRKIFAYIETHPEKLAEIKKFTEYFLPTTLKLVDAYKKLDYQSIDGDNISNSKKEIEDTMDTINLAFKNLLDSLFVDMAMDISTDITVLNTLLKQEGLTEDEIMSRNTREEKDEQ